MKPIVLAALALTVSVSATAQENWPRFRGVNGAGIAENDPRLPDTWDKDTSVQWVRGIRGWGWSSPVIWGDCVFVTSGYGDEIELAPDADEWNRERDRIDVRGVKISKAWKPGGTYHWMVYCLDIHSGDLLWSREAYTGRARAF